jgi:hypothetical protein
MTAGDSQTTWAQHVESRLARHRASVERLKQLSATQASLIEAAQGEVLLAVLTERQQTIDSLMTGPTSLASILADLEGSAAWIDAALNERVRQMLQGISADLNDIVSGDERDRNEIQTVCRQLQQELAESSTVRQARAAYGPRSSKGTTYTDHRG